MAPEDLDSVDEGILARLHGDARNVTTADIAEDLDLAASTVATRISRLEDDGVITGYWPGIDYERVGYDQHLLLRGTVPNVDGTLEDLLAVEGVICLNELLTDEGNVTVHLVGRSQSELEARSEQLNDAGLEIEETNVVERNVRRPGNVFGGDDASGRRPGT